MASLITRRAVTSYRLRWAGRSSFASVAVGSDLVSEAGPDVSLQKARSWDEGVSSNFSTTPLSEIFKVSHGIWAKFEPFICCSFDLVSGSLLLLFFCFRGRKSSSLDFRWVFLFFFLTKKEQSHRMFFLDSFCVWVKPVYNLVNDATSVVVAWTIRAIPNWRNIQSFYAYVMWRCH